MNDRDKTYLLKELTKTIYESDSTAAFCLCQRWILKATLNLLKEQESVIEALKSDLDETLEVLVQKPEVILCKDCKHGKPCNEDVFCTKDIGTIESSVHKPDWYCADGERKCNGID